MPIIEGEAVNQSDAWLAIAHTLSSGSAGSVDGVEDRAANSVADLPRDYQVLIGLLDRRIGDACSAGGLESGGWAPMIAETGDRLFDDDDLGFDRSQLEALAEDATSDKHDLVDKLLARMAKKADSKIHNAAEQERLAIEGARGSHMPIEHEGEACLEACGGIGGVCPTGFCGAGVCCRRFHPSGVCPVGLHGGCLDRHCCIPRPERSSSAERTANCTAAPGEYCLVSLFPGLQGTSMTDAERCILERSKYPCPPGLFCPGRDTAPMACRRGRLCLPGAAIERPCPAGKFCPVSIMEQPCPEAHMCAENSKEPLLCPPGSYCVGGLNYTCPEGHVCGAGTVHPIRCAFLASCPVGSGQQGFSRFSKAALVASSLLWLAAMRMVPWWVQSRGGIAGIVPTAAVVFVFVLAWAVNLNLVYTVARLVGLADERVGFLHAWRFLGFRPHMTGLVFLTVTYTLMIYGFFVSVNIASRRVRCCMDAFLLLMSCITFCCFLEDWHAGVFISNIGVAFKLVFVLVTQQGPWKCRIGALGVAFFVIFAGFHALGMPSLGGLLVVASAAAVAKELVAAGFAHLIARLGLARAGASVSGNAAAAIELVRCVGWVSPASGSSAALDSAAAAIAAARASLDEACRAQREAKMARRPKAVGLDFRRHSRASPSSAWVPHYDRHAGDSDSDEEMSSPSSWSKQRPGCAKDTGGGIAFQLKDVSFKLEDGRRLLQELTFTVPAGASAAVMGASGAGKTTLLSLLSGRCGEARLSGELRLNGARMKPSSIAKLRPLMGYVPQDDVLHSCLTVRENIEFQAELRLRHTMKGHPDVVSRQLRERIEFVLEGLGLAHVADRAISSGLSGGQRKRASIGMEIVSRPCVMMLDEPSSGLDASTAHRIIDTVLEGAGTEHCTTFATIHQPRWSTLSLFDMLILLAPGGHLVYAGPVAGVKAYFMAVPQVDFPSNQNPADVFIDATAFDSARVMVVEGVWKNPPQCLRAVLIPTPEMEDEERQEPWQTQEFGKMLGALWRSFAGEPEDNVDPQFFSPNGDGPDEGAKSLASSDGEDAPVPLRASCTEARALTLAAQPSSPVRYARLAKEADDRVEDMHWAEQIWLHIARALLVTCRQLWPTIIVNQALTMGVVCLFSLAMPTLGVRIFLKLALLCALLCAVQSVPAQRIFGGEERRMAAREAAINSPSQVVFSFVGKDLAALPEIALGAVCVALTYWPLVSTTASGSDLFSFAFMFHYAIWGMNYIWSVAFDPHTAMLLGVIASFMSFLFSGTQPETGALLAAMRGHGALLLLGSPCRWALGAISYWHTTGMGSTFVQPDFMAKFHGDFYNAWYDLKLLPGTCPDRSASVLERWRSRNSWACHTGQLVLLGLLFRFIAASLLLLTCAAKASGGELSFGASSRLRAHILRNLVGVLLVFFFLLEVALLGQTY